MAILVGVLYAAGLYMMLRRNLVKLLIGLMLLGHAANLLIFNMGHLERGYAPFIHEGAKYLEGSFSDPLPQALILTAIVIGFGVQAFSVVLFRLVYRISNSDDVDEMRSTDI